MEPATRNGHRVPTNPAIDRPNPTHRRDDSAPGPHQLTSAPMCRGGKCNWPAWLSGMGLFGTLGCVIGGMIVGPTPLGAALMILALISLVCLVAAINR